MELILFVIMILLIVILSKLSTLKEKLNKIEKHLNINEVKKSTVTSIPQPSIKKEPPLKEKISQQKIKSELKPKKEPLSSQIERKFKGVAIEELLFGNIILKIAIFAFILGIGLFLKYSIDKDWIPIWGRVLIGVAIGIAMLIAGIKMIRNTHKLFSETLFGGGIAILYLSIFAGFALDGFKFIEVNHAFIVMIFITFLAGVISVRFNAKSTAIFGLIGGFATPFLLSSGSENYVGLLEYFLLLNLGILFISIYKKWSLLSWMAFAITSVTSLSVVWETQNDFLVLLLLFSAFFIIYSIVPFINEIRSKEQKLKKAFVFLFWANFIVAILSFLALFEHYHIETIYYAVVTISLAGYLLAYSAYLSKKSQNLKNLFYIVLGQSMALLLATPAFIFTQSSLTIVWAIESLLLLWISTKSQEKTYGLFGLVGFVITLIRYLSFDLIDKHYLSVSEIAYLQSLAVVSLFVIGSLFSAYKLLEKSSVEFVYFTTNTLKTILFFLSFGGAFLLLNYMGLILTNVYILNIFSIISMVFIALFVLLLDRSHYANFSKHIYTFFLLLLGLHFAYNVININMNNTLLSLINFLLFMGVSIFIYRLAFQKDIETSQNRNLSKLFLGLGVGVLFLFLNVELYHLVKLYAPEATKFAITLLWIIFGITLFVYGVLKDFKQAKIVGTVLILVAILKAFFFDLANLDAIYRIVLFLILGVILFGLSYFYQSKNKEIK